MRKEAMFIPLIDHLGIAHSALDYYCCGAALTTHIAAAI